MKHLIIFLTLLIFCMPALAADVNRDYINEVIFIEHPFNRDITISEAELLAVGSNAMTPQLGSGWAYADSGGVSAFSHAPETGNIVGPWVEVNDLFFNYNLQPGSYKVSFNIVMVGGGVLAIKMGNSVPSGKIIAPGSINIPVVFFVTPTVREDIKLRIYCNAAATTAVYWLDVRPLSIESRVYNRNDLGRNLTMYYSLPGGGPITPSYFVSNDGINWITDTNYTMTSDYSNASGAVTYITDTSGPTNNGRGTVSFTPSLAKYIKFVFDTTIFGTLGSPDVPGLHSTPAFSCTINGN